MQPIHAVNFAPFSPRGAFSTPQAKAGLCAMKEQTCADTVIFCPGAVQATPFVEQIDFQGKHTTSDEELLDMTRLARQLGLRVFWKPTVNCLDGTWRARISFFDHDVPCETKWSGWFASYRAFQLHFARLAQQAGVELLILGCEMTQTEHREQEWRQLIAAIREVYTGALSYNCDKYGEEYVSWWDALDVICSSGYYPIDQMEQNLNRIEQTVNTLQKPLLFCRGRVYAGKRFGLPSQRLVAARIGRSPGAGSMVSGFVCSLRSPSLVWGHGALGLAVKGSGKNEPLRLCGNACAGGHPHILQQEGRIKRRNGSARAVTAPP